MRADIFEDHKFSFKRHFKRRLDYYVAIVCIAAMIIIFSQWIFIWNIKWDVTVDSLIQALGQFATVGALVFAVIQFRISKERDRQATLFSESKILIEKIATSFNQVTIGYGKNELSDLMTAIVKSDNYAYHLLAIAGSLESRVDRSIIGVYWQDMFFHTISSVSRAYEFDKFIPAIFKELRSYPIFKQEALDYASNQNNEDLFEYNYAFYMLKECRVPLNIDKSLKSSYVISALERFQQHFFEERFISMYLSDQVIRPNFKFQAPVWAAIYHVRIFLGVEGDMQLEKREAERRG